MHSIKDTWLEWYKDGRIEESVATLAKELIAVKARTVLDFGTGTGRHTIYLAGIGFDVYGFDWSEAAIKATKEALAKQGLSANLTVCDMTVTPLPYLDEFFDAVIAVRVIHHTYIEKIQRIASEITRITKTGGYVYIECPTYEKALKQKQDGARSEEPEPGTFIPLEGNEVGVPHHHFRLDEMLRLMGRFDVRRLEEKDGHYCFAGVKK